VCTYLEIYNYATPPSKMRSRNLPRDISIRDASVSAHAEDTVKTGSSAFGSGDKNQEKNQAVFVCKHSTFLVVPSSPWTRCRHLAPSHEFPNRRCLTFDLTLRYPTNATDIKRPARRGGRPRCTAPRRAVPRHIFHGRADERPCSMYISIPPLRGVRDDFICKE